MSNLHINKAPKNFMAKTTDQKKKRNKKQSQTEPDLNLLIEFETIAYICTYIFYIQLFE